MGNSTISFRRGNLADLPALQAVYVMAIRRHGIRDYTSAQVAAWAGTISRVARWEAALREQVFWVAEAAGQVVGFASLKDGHYVDFLYVHPEWRGQGIAQRLLAILTTEAHRQGHARMTADVSITARSFFERQGFMVIHPNRNLINGVELINYRMQRDSATPLT
jgi:putative acetyltransferase